MLQCDAKLPVRLCACLFVGSSDRNEKKRGSKSRGCAPPRIPSRGNPSPPVPYPVDSLALSLSHRSTSSCTLS
ncbi:hypothetical protein GWI33_006599 [Rhynchophorus ferrugineus]|uniref:Uncharacterized protein n=1 Tax=Rhynchophorus ferrugineus TaxID=354439 RepID=A0A834MIV2_RHYFE|nr:hypothetical protein GWI33_006599 [Rhynchophorus ferrugineus]